MQFQIPQFIETEDKIIAGLTFRQFAYVGAAILIVLLLFFVLSFALWFFVALVLGGGAVSLAFVKMNGRPLIVYISAFLSSIWSPSVYVFRPTIPTKKLKGGVTVPVEASVKLAPQKTPLDGKKTTQKKAPLFGGIKGLRSWISTSKTAIPRREKPLPRDFGMPQKKIEDKFEVVRHLTGEREVARRVDYR